LGEMRSALPKVKVPVLLIHSRHDHDVVPHNAELIFNQLGTQDKQLFWVENSGHNIPRETDRLLVFSKADEFIRRIQSARQSL